MCVGLCDGRMYAWRILSHAESREQLDAPRNCSIRSYNSRCENKLHVWQHLHNQTCRDSGKNYNMTSSELLHRSQIKPGLGRGRLTAVLGGGGGWRGTYTLQVKRSYASCPCHGTWIFDWRHSQQNIIDFILF